MTKQYSFNQDQMNGIVEEIYTNIIKECKRLKDETECPDEQVVALLSVIASRFAPIIEKIINKMTKYFTWSEFDKSVDYIANQCKF